MSEHTPGPWIVSKKLRDPGCIVIHTPEGRSIASAWCLLGPHGEPADTPMEANAHLIVAAPDLLAACEALLAECAAYRGFHPDAGLLVAARAAIAKARGA